MFDDALNSRIIFDPHSVISPEVVKQPSGGLSIEQQVVNHRMEVWAESYRNLQEIPLLIEYVDFLYPNEPSQYFDSWLKRRKDAERKI